MSKDPDLDDYFRPWDVPLAPEQLEMRKRTLKQIETDRDGFDMCFWESTAENEAELARRPADECKTTRCVAGWAQFIARGKVTHGGSDGPDVVTDAIALLGLTYDEFHSTRDSDGLFYTDEDDALRVLRKLAGES